MKKFQSKVTLWIVAAVVLLVGIFSIIAGASNDGSGYEEIALTLGIAFVAVSGIAILAALIVSVMNKKGFASIALGSAGLLACGIFFLVERGVAATLIACFLGFVPYILLVEGVIVLVDAVLTLIFNIKNIKAYLVSFIVALVIAGVAITLGALMVADVITMGARFIVFGIVLCLVAAYILLASITVKTVVAVATVDAEVVNEVEVAEEAKAEEVQAEENKDAE